MGEDEICEMRVVMESTAAGLQKEKLNNEIKDSKIEQLNEKDRRISEEKMRMKNENDKSIEDLELSKRKAEEEHLSQQEVAKKTIWELEEAMSLQQQQHLSSTETYKELLRSMEVEVSVAEEMLNDSKVKCVQNEGKLEEREKEIIMLRKDRKDNEVEMEEKMKLISIREKERDEMIWQKERKSEEQLEAMKSLKNKHACLENEISEMRIVMESTREGLQKEQAKNDMKDSTIEELNEKVCKITEEKMRMKSENDESIEDLELSKKVAEDELLSQQEVAKAALVKLEEAMSVQQQQHSSYKERSNEILRGMQMKLGVTEKELNDIKVKCVQNEETLDENEKEIVRLRKERECNEVEMEEKMKVISTRDEELNEMRRQWDMKIEEELETVKSLKSKNTSL